MFKIAILLATYNSAKYLQEQLDSLYNQTCLDWDLYVHDDGSNDSTPQILDSYQKKYGNITIVGKDIKGLGAKKNFMFLLTKVDADYYMLCDHDDIWLKDKVEISISEIKKAENNDTNIPVIFHSDLIPVDGKLNQISDSMWKYAKIQPELMHKRNYVMTSCYITGCTLAFNNSAKLLIPPMPENAIMHDWWIGIHAVLKNMKIISYPKATMLYRLHGNNTAGISKISFLPYLRYMFKSTFESKYDRQVKPFVKQYNIRCYKWNKFKLICHRFIKFNL